MPVLRMRTWGKHRGGANPVKTVDQNGVAVPESKSTRALAVDILKLAVPTLAVVLCEPILTLIDTWFVGSMLAAEPAKAGLAALSANCSLFNLIACCMSFLTIASTSLVASAGGGRKAGGKGLKKGLEVAVPVGCLMAGAFIYWSKALLVTGFGMDASAASFSPAVQYLSIRALALPAILSQNVLVGVSLGIKEASAPVVGCLVAAVTNVVLDYALIVSAGWGISGAAAATAAASYMGLFSMAVALKNKIEMEPWRVQASSLAPSLQFAIRDWVQQLSSAKLRSLRVSSNVLLLMGTTASGLTYSMTARSAVLGSVGDASVAAGAAHQIALQTWWFFSYFATPLSMTVQSLLPRAIAEGKFLEARRLIWAQLIISSALNLAVTGLTWAAPTYFSYAFSKDAEVIGLAQIHLN